ncbi:MAG TPA: hypothetical protein PLE74_09540, partial [Candidatus Cloacimonadota bacterium]|nr:hypothetical protein [Candidatus Cloacimonadota bacterium]
MMQRLILISLLLIFTWTLFAQDLINNDEQLKNDIIKVNYKQKNAKLAMVMSALVPGAGQFYANKKAITAYIFPVVEAGLIYGYLNNMKKGHDIENDYKNYATGEAVEYPAIDGEGNHLTGPRYKYSFQFATQDNLISIHSDDIYDNIYFRWNYTNIEYNQHFYEDIGKYNKYIFGWADWHYEYAYNGTT